VIACEFGLITRPRAGADHRSYRPYFRPDSQVWIDEQIEVIKAGGRPIVNQPKSFPWEESGPPTQRPGFEETDLGRYTATLRGGLGNTAEDAINALRAIRAWDTRPRAAELAAPPMPVLVMVGGTRRRRRSRFLRMASEHPAASL
jgi:hypothetical protein